MADHEKLPRGAYYQVVTQGLRERLQNDHGRPIENRLEPSEAADRLAGHLRDAIAGALSSLPASQRQAEQIALTNELLEWLSQRSKSGLDDQAVSDPPMVLRLLTENLLRGEQPPALPDIPLLDNDLLTNAPGEPSLAHSLRAELETADQVDAVIAFIRWTGLRYLCPVLAALRQKGRRIRVLTTTFTGSTERRALDWLCENDIEVRVSYETRTTRLHAKSWIIHRDSGFSSAFVGSSNLSHAALVDGIEWNLRLARKNSPSVFDKLCATFDSLWNEESFEPYDSARDGDRFDRAVSATSRSTPVTGVSGLEIRPWPYQREILESLVVERQRFGRLRNLVVAPTGTGKTVLAALDYRALREGEGGTSVARDATMLFVAHREQILDQSLQTFRDVLQRGDFGEKLVGGHSPNEWRHVFASIQSLHQLDADKLDPERFEVIYVDEFHHGEARTYRNLLDRLKPRVLVGLTATPERTDGLNVRERYFGGRYAFEMRLWDALDQQLLSPFHYFGVADGTDLSTLRWEKGGYRIRDLEARYVVHDGHDARTSKVLAALHERVADPRAMRAFGFCVSVAHAHYMANRFQAAGIPAVAMDGGVATEERSKILERLRRLELNVVFAVDVLTEGIDVPQVDTIILLRPTESATVFLQQIGRGLRLHKGKDVCTVLDFIGQQHQRFRSDLRLRAMTGRSRGELIKAAEQGFPYLPSGCQIQLDRQAEAHIIENLKTAINSSAAAMARELQDLEQQFGTINLARFLEEALYELDDIYRSNLGWTALRRRAGSKIEPPGPRETEMGKAIRLRFQEINDPERIAMMRVLGGGEPIPADERSQQLATMLGFILFDDGKAPETLAEVQQALSSEPALQRELLELADVLDTRAAVLTRPSSLWPDVPLHLHATYSRAEVLVAMGARALGKKTAMREGVKYVKARNTDLLFVTLQKSERHYSPTTRYRDYALSRDLFRWESQSHLRRKTPTGKRYLEGTSTVLLFVRSQPKDSRGRAPGFMFLGPVTLTDSRGEKPIQITWRLSTPMPESMLQASRAIAG